MQLYIDYLSQPSRAVLAFCIHQQLPVQIVQTRIAKAQHLSPQLAKLTPFRKVPVLKDGDYSLAESHTIMRYLSAKYKKQSLYTKDQQKRGKIDMYLDYHLNGTRKLSEYLFNKEFAPKLGLKVRSDMDFLKEQAQNILRFIDKKLLGAQNAYLANNQLSIADFSAFCQIKQLELTGWNFSQLPNIRKWMSRLQEVRGLKQAHLAFEKLKARMLSLQTKL